MELHCNMNNRVSFIIGLLVGIMICVILYYVDVKLLKPAFNLNKNKVIITHVVRDTVYIEGIKKEGLHNEKNIRVNTATDEFYGDNQLKEDTYGYDDDFSLESDDQNSIFTDHLLHTRTVKVKFVDQEILDAALPDNFFHIFEIQQWDTPIKNKVTYFRSQNMIKIRGMEIGKVNVVFINDQYLLEVGNRYFAIPETENFESLNLISLNK